MTTMRLRVAAAALGMMLGFVGCGPSVCSGTSCACPSGESCGFDACNASTSGCNFSCAPGATCTGTCGANCSVSCNGASCTHTVGAGSSVTCSSGSCNITCEGTCSVVGNANLTCGGGTTQGPAGCQ